jgi:hypothetical protein
MLVVIPVSAHDSGLIADFCEIINFFAPYRGHRLLVVGCPSAQSYVEDVFSKISNKFDSSELHLFSAKSPVGWPEGPNFYFQKTVEHLRGGAHDWFWMEMDCTPVADRWLDSLSQEYAECGKPCLGVIQDIRSGEGIHLVGVAVYPKNFDEVCPDSLRVASFDEAFDYYLRKELVPISAQSRLLQHNFRTHHYRCTHSGMLGVEEARRRDNVRFDVPVGREAAVVHGCNDGSLARLILGNGSF